MGGQDKALVTLHGQTLLNRAMAQLAPQTRFLVLSTNADPAIFSGFGLPTLADRFPGFPGPLAGIHAGLAAYPKESLLTVAIDIAYFPDDLVARLRAGLGQATCAYAFDGTHHALALLWAPHSADRVAAYLDTGRRSLKGFLAEHGVAVRFDRPQDRGLFLNLNTPEDLARAERELVAP
jgi:molybdopterin-guanine dinucleotide biosynthesis protein A